MVKLRKALTDSTSELDAKEEELIQLKRGVKFSRVRELETDKNAFEEEAKRLSRLLEEATNQRLRTNMYVHTRMHERKGRSYLTDRWVRHLNSRRNTGRRGNG